MGATVVKRRLGERSQSFGQLVAATKDINARIDAG